MEQYNLFSAKTHLSNLVRRAASGEEIIIARNGVPQARLVPLDFLTDKPARTPGRLKGMLRESDDFDQTPEEILQAFEGLKS